MKTVIIEDVLLTEEEIQTLLCARDLLEDMSDGIEITEKADRCFDGVLMIEDILNTIVTGIYSDE